MTKTIEITYRHGRPFAAYLHLARRTEAHARTREVTPSLLVDLDVQGEAVGLEILAFDDRTIGQINDVLVSLGHTPLSAAEMAPLHAA